MTVNKNEILPILKNYYLVISPTRSNMGVLSTWASCFDYNFNRKLNKSPYVEQP